MTVEPTDEMLRDHLRQRAATATVTASPRPLIEARADRIRTRRRRTRWAVAVAALLIALGGAMLAVRTLTSHPAVVHYEDSGPTTSESTTTLAPVVSEGQSHAQTPLYPEETRAALVKAWNALAFCMQNHGATDFPMVPDNYGDGTVPQPVLEFTPQVQDAMGQCSAENEAVRQATLVANGHPELIPGTLPPGNPPGG
jgi:hypothetical protein